MISSVVATLAFVLGGLTRSPWEGAVANAGADPAVTAHVARHDFAVPVITVAGTASAGATTDVVPIASESGRTIVTAVRTAAGSELQAGQVLAEVSGRPLIALDLPFDLYRDLVPGDSGPDVTALQQALSDVGVSTSPVDGTFGPRTSAAIRTLYEQSAVTPPQPAAEQTAALDDALSALHEASVSTASPSGTGAEPSEGPGSGGGEESGTRDGGDAQKGTETSATLARLQQTVDEARIAADTPLPMAEIITVPATGVQVMSVAPVGTSLAGESSSVATLRQGNLSATARVGVKDAATFPLGASVTVTPSTGGPGVDGTVATVSDFEGASDASQLPGFDITVTFPPETAGLDDGGTIVVRPAGASQTRSGLSVPLVAVRNEGAQTYVLVVTGSAVRTVDVTVDMSADGLALVTSDALDDGDTVLISGTP